MTASISTQRLTTAIAYWLSTEIVFTVIGLDTVADYQEFLQTIDDKRRAYTSGLICKVHQNTSAVFGATAYHY